MNKAHEQGHNSIVQALSDDPRILSAYSGGTTNTVTEDEYSDVDSFFVAKDEEMESLRPDIIRLIEENFPKLLMLACYPPSGPAENIAFHFLFESDEIGIGKYDLRLVRASNPFLCGTYTEVMRKQVMFDKTGNLEMQLKENQSRIPTYDPGALRLTVERYWQAVVMQVKFIIRHDPFKLEYIQNGLFQTHIEILHALCPSGMIWDWWARKIREFLPEDRQQNLLLYLDGLSDVNNISAAAGPLMRQFDEDARKACGKWGIAYPERLATTVMDYFDAKIGKHIRQA